MSAPIPHSLGQIFPDDGDPQAPVGAAVIMPTLMRPVAARAIESIYAQDAGVRIQIVIGADLNPGDTGPIFEALQRRPPHVSALVLTLPYSTSVRHGGMHPAWDGGALRTILSFAANAPYLAYLDDDNVWRPHHLRRLLEAVQGRSWAYSLRMLLDEDTGAELGVDIWDAVGPNKGRFKERGGMVDPNCLLIDKRRVAGTLWMWSDPGPGLLGLEADRRVAAALARHPYGAVDEATVLYRIRRTNILRQFLKDGAQF